MIQKRVLRAGAYYQLIKYINRGNARGAAIYQVEDTLGQLICHCGSSVREAEQLFDALEYPARRRAPASVL